MYTLGSRIVVDATNPVLFLEPDSPDRKDRTNPLAAYGIKAVDLKGRASGEVFAERVPGARVVKAFNLARRCSSAPLDQSALSAY